MGPYVCVDLTTGHLRLAGSLCGGFGMHVLRPYLPDQDEGGVCEWTENLDKELWSVDDPSEVSAYLDACDVVLMDAGSTGRWNVDPSELRSRNPRAIICLITPFGRDGPRSSELAGELTLQASSAHLYLIGHVDRPPVPLPGNQSTYQAAAQAVFAVTAALFDRDLNAGAGDIVDVSIQEAMCNALVNSKASWTAARVDLQRSHRHRVGAVGRRIIWDARDGYIGWSIALGRQSGQRMRALVDWMIEDAGIGQELAGVSWDSISATDVDESEYRGWEGAFAAFFSMKTKMDLFRGALARDLTLVPVMELSELLEDDHLQIRTSFQTIATPKGNATFPAFPVRPGTTMSARRTPNYLSSPPEAIAESKIMNSELVSDRADAGPLSGVNVLDFSWMVAGPAATRVLGMLGATVIKVETHQRYDSTRLYPPFFGDPTVDNCGLFNIHNNNKLSLCLDLNSDGSRDVVKSLVEWADVVCENFTAGRLEEWGLDPDTLFDWNPRLVLLRSSSWGQTGPYAKVPTNGIVLSGFTGLADLTGWPDRPPMLSTQFYTDMVSPWFSATAIVSAVHKQRTGAGTSKGIVLDVSQLECMLNFLGPEIALTSLGEAPQRSGSFVCDPYPRGVLACRLSDTWCAFSVEGREQWKALCQAFPELSGSEDVSESAIAELEAYLPALLQDRTSNFTASEAADWFQAAGVAAAEVIPTSGLFSDPQLRHRRHFVDTEHPAIGQVPYDMPSFRFAERTVNVTRSPLIGEHTTAILEDMLNLGSDDIAELVASGVVA